MVKLIGPSMSIDASGKLANVLSFSKWKGRKYARKAPRPANPRSGMQVGGRSMFKFLSPMWAQISAPDQATWEPGAEAASISPFNFFMSHNLALWRRFTAPTLYFNPAVPGGPGTIGTFTATGGPRHVTLQIQITDPADNWGILIFRSPTASFSTAVANCIAAIVGATTATFPYLDANLEPATYYYDVRLFSDWSAMGAEKGEIPGTAT